METALGAQYSAEGRRSQACDRRWCTRHYSTSRPPIASSSAWDYWCSLYHKNGARTCGGVVILQPRTPDHEYFIGIMLTTRRAAPPCSSMAFTTHFAVLPRQHAPDVPPAAPIVDGLKLLLVLSTLRKNAPKRSTPLSLGGAGGAILKDNDISGGGAEDGGAHNVDKKFKLRVRFHRVHVARNDRRLPHCSPYLTAPHSCSCSRRTSQGVLARPLCVCAGATTHLVHSQIQLIPCRFPDPCPHPPE
ncbi:hypothetical protein B0H11DRAFT_446193 [Mycena galericulata]|nr:hypothetical protein B0H11DRAFT_446193 [Mycena galericulata]